MRRRVVLLLAGVVIVGGCSESSTPPPAPHTTAPVAGGTPSMRARARSALALMGSTPIAAIRFSRPPASFAQFKHVAHPAWMTVTVRAPGMASAGGGTATSWALGYAAIFERAYQAAVPRGGYRLLGIGESSLWNGKMHVDGSGVSGVPEWAGAHRTPQQVTATVKHAASAAGFTLTALRVFPLKRIAAAATLLVSTHHDFASRLDAFGAAMSRLGYATDGVQWELHDTCGNVVAQVAGGTYLNPRWECPNPWAIGLDMPAGECKKLAAQAPTCR